MIMLFHTLYGMIRIAHKQNVPLVVGRWIWFKPLIG